MGDFTRLSHRKRYIGGNRPVSSAVDKEILHRLSGSRRLWVVRFDCSGWAAKVKQIACIRAWCWSKLPSAIEGTFMKKAFLFVASLLILGVGELRAQTAAPAAASLTVIRAGTLIDGSSN